MEGAVVKGVEGEAVRDVGWGQFGY